MELAFLQTRFGAVSGERGGQMPAQHRLDLRLQKLSASFVVRTERGVRVPRPTRPPQAFNDGQGIPGPVLLSAA
jgi:hypothetical protein